MWAKIGDVIIADMGQEYYLVTIAIEKDHDFALMEGPWLIYDHYLLVREQRVSFCPSGDTIKQLVGWVRILGPPIEYYDNRVLQFIVDRIGKTVKVDKNTLTKEIGKYVRLCIQVDLNKPLLAKFSIKGRRYKVEYEDSHMMYLSYGRFGHRVKFYGERKVAILVEEETNESRPK